MERNQIYEFGGFRLDPVHRTLIRPDGEPVALTPKVFETLLCLVEHAGAVVSKTELMESVWGDRVVEENSLNQHISILRRTLGETPGDNRFILTVPGRGYRFIASVKTVMPEPDQPIAATNEADTPSHAGVPMRRTGLTAKKFGAAIAGLLAFAGGAVMLSAFLTNPAPQPGPVVRSVIARDGDTLPGEISATRDMTISPDGTRIVYTDGRRRGPLFVHVLERLRPDPLRGTEGGISPVFSPDGREIAFVMPEGATSTLKRIAVLGGPVRDIATVDGFARGLSWGPGDTIVFATEHSGGLLRVSAAGGEPERLTSVDSGQGESEHYWPGVLRNGRGVLFTAWRETAEQSTLAVMSFGTGEVTYLPLTGSHPIHAPTGHVLFASAGALRAVAFDSERLALTTDAAVPVIERLKTQPTGAAQFDVSDNGSLVYVLDDSVAPADTRLVWVDRSGREEPISLLARPYGHVRVSPKGDRIAAVIGTRAAWVSDSGLTRLSEVSIGGWWILWSRDGRRVVAQRGLGLAWGSADGNSVVEQLVTGVPGTVIDPNAWSADGRSLLFTYGTTGDFRIGELDMDTREWRPLIDRGRSVSTAEVAPGGDWLAYWENGKNEIYVERYPELGDRWLVSGQAGGTQPVWAPDGKELYYRRPADGAMMAVGIETTTDGLEIGAPEMLFMVDSPFPLEVRYWDIAPDGRFLMIKATGPPQIRGQRLGIILVQNWFQELQRLAPLP